MHAWVLVTVSQSLMDIWGFVGKTNGEDGTKWRHLVPNWRPSTVRLSVTWLSLLTDAFSLLSGPCSEPGSQCVNMFVWAFFFFFFFLLLLLHAFCLHQVCMRVCVWRWRRAAPHHCGSCCWLATVCVWRPPTRSDRRWISMWLRASPSWATVSVFCVTLSPKVLINHDIRYARRVYCHARWKSTVKLKMKQKRITLWSMKAHLKLYAHAKLRLFCGALTVYTTDWTQMVQQHVGQQYNRTQSLYVLRRTRISAVLMRWED